MGVGCGICVAFLVEFVRWIGGAGCVVVGSCITAAGGGVEAVAGASRGGAGSCFRFGFGLELGAFGIWGIGLVCAGARGGGGVCSSSPVVFDVCFGGASVALVVVSCGPLPGPVGLRRSVACSRAVLLILSVVSSHVVIEFSRVFC